MSVPLNPRHGTLAGSTIELTQQSLPGRTQPL